VPEERAGVVRYLVPAGSDGERLDRILAALTGLSRRRARSLVEEGRLWLNSASVRVLSRTVRIGDVVDVIPGAEPLAAPPPPPATLEIVHEDGWLVAINKPPGIASQPPRERHPGELTAQEAVALQLGWRDGQRAELLLFHRLDRITSGLLLLARHHNAARALARAWGEGMAEKTYLAVVRGDPGAAPLAIARAIGRDQFRPGRFRTDRDGKPARTEVVRLAAAGDLALVRARPLTGRSHQVRVHLAELGFPVAGDRLYGAGSRMPRPFLHAWRLALPHPRDGATLRLEAPLPADMLAFLEAHGLGPELESSQRPADG
jgi:23S rRNA pseudouridine1911/1915/1917 synthase